MNNWCSKCPIEQKVLQCMPFGKFVKIYNPDNPKLYTVIAVNSPILDEMCKTNPSRIPKPLPLDHICYPGALSPGKSKSGRNRKKNKKPKQLEKDLWGT